METKKAQFLADFPLTFLASATAKFVRTRTIASQHSQINAYLSKRAHGSSSITNMQISNVLSFYWGDWGEMKQGQVKTVTITFMDDSA